MLSRNLSRVSVALLLGGYLALAQTPVGPVTFTYDGPPLNIPHTENSIATFVSIPVSAVATVTKVTATVNISYAPVSDLNIYLFSPDGTRTRLLEKNCVGINATLVNMTFDDSASTTYTSSCPAEAGRGPWRGTEPRANFANKPAAGTWTLAVQNNSTPGNTGVLNGFSLTLSGTSPLTPT